MCLCGGVEALGASWLLLRCPMPMRRRRMRHAVLSRRGALGAAALCGSPSARHGKTQGRGRRRFAKEAPRCCGCWACCSLAPMASPCGRGPPSAARGGASPPSCPPPPCGRRMPLKSREGTGTSCSCAVPPPAAEPAAARWTSSWCLMSPGMIGCSQCRRRGRPPQAMSGSLRCDGGRSTAQPCDRRCSSGCMRGCSKARPSTCC
mmetsp:Transcript_44240/g.127897  ORF Transcript_44240/g.127897 Transcript_44240/m.127897 type:complete len:205 (-) Transcript_44240:1148-1762(-)